MKQHHYQIHYKSIWGSDQGTRGMNYISFLSDDKMTVSINLLYIHTVVIYMCMTKSTDPLLWCFGIKMDQANRYQKVQYYIFVMNVWSANWWNHLCTHYHFCMNLFCILVILKLSLLFYKDKVSMISEYITYA